MTPQLSQQRVFTLAEANVLAHGGRIDGQRYCDLVNEPDTRAFAAFCRRLAEKRFKRYHARANARAAAPKTAAPKFNTKEKSALAKEPEEYAKWLQKFPDRVAAVVAKTYSEMGDSAFTEGIPDDVALVMIRDMLNEGDDTLIPRNANKKLARHRQSS